MEKKQVSHGIAAFSTFYIFSEKRLQNHIVQIIIKLYLSSP